MLARAKNYAEAQRIKKIADKLEDKEKSSMETQTAAIFARKEAQFRQQQQAELQALLATSAESAGIPDAAVRTEGAAEVEGVPGVWEVSGRLAGSAAGPASSALLRELSRHRWVRVDLLEIRDDGTDRLQMIVRGYYRMPVEAVAP